MCFRWGKVKIKMKGLVKCVVKLVYFFKWKSWPFGVGVKMAFLAAGLGAVKHSSCMV